MIIRKHISFEKEYVEKMQPFLTKHDGNFSAAIRDIIDLAMNAKADLNYSDSIMLFDSQLANLLLKKTTGIIPDREILEEIIDSQLSNSIYNALEYFNAKFKELEWEIELCLISDSATVPTTSELIVKGENYLQIDMSARIFSQFLAIKKSLGIETIRRRLKSIELIYKRRGNSEAALNDLKNHLGIMQDLFGEIEKHPDFWRIMVKKYIESNYKMVAVHLNFFEDLLAKKIPTGEIGIELIAKHPIRDIPHHKLLNLMKEVYENAGIIENIDIEGDTIKVFHSYRDSQAVDTLTKIFLNLFRLNGHNYEAKSARNLIIFQHMPKIGIGLSNLIMNLNKSYSDYNREIIALLTFLHGLKDEIKIFDSLHILGYMMSKPIFEKYEIEHKIHEWDIKTFQEALSTFDSKIGRQSEFMSIDENGCLMSYTINKCNLVYIGGELNVDICEFSCGFLKGAIEYAFKNKAEMKIIKQLVNNDDKCEFLISYQDKHAVFGTEKDITGQKWTGEEL